MKSARLSLRMVLVSLVLLFGLGLHGQTGPGVPMPTGSGKALYVAPSGGDDAYTREQNDLTHPWATVQRAWYQARPGDVVYFRAGTYSPTEMIDTQFPGYDGTAENPITFTNYPGEIAIIDGANVNTTFSIQKNHNSVIGTKVGNEYGFQFINYVTCFRTGENIGGYHFTVIGCRGIANRYGDNTGFVRVWGGDQVVIKNNKISGCGTTGHNNTAGIFVSPIRNVKILNNEIDNCVSGIYYKYPNNFTLQNDIEIAYNYIYDCYTSQFVCSKAKIHNNIFVNTVTMGNDGGGVSATNSHADYNQIYNNTFNVLNFIIDGPTSDPLRGCTYNTIQNNVFLVRQTWHQYGQPSPGYDYHNDTDYNLYKNPDAIRQNEITYTLQEWRQYQLNTYSRVVDAHSLTGQPVFVGGATPTTIAGFALAAGSPGKNAGSDGKDMGADVSRVGIQPLSSLSVTSPNGAESWRRGETRAITWAAAGVTENLVIELMQGPTLLGVIAADIAPGSGSTTWTVGRLADGSFRTGANLKIRIRTASGRVLGTARLGAR